MILIDFIVNIFSHYVFNHKNRVVHTMKSKIVAYLLWTLGLFGLGGIHRLYCGKIFSGILFLFTLGLFGIGQLIDFILIPAMVDEANLKYRGINIKNTQIQNQNQQVVVNLGDYLPQSNKQTSEKSDIQIILQLAKDNNGASISDCVLATNKSPKEVKKLISELCQEQLLEPTNHPTNGAVIYKVI